MKHWFWQTCPLLSVSTTTKKMFENMPMNLTKSVVVCPCLFGQDSVTESAILEESKIVFLLWNFKQALTNNSRNGDSTTSLFRASRG